MMGHEFLFVIRKNVGMKKGRVSGKAWTSVLEEDGGLRHNHYVVDERQCHNYENYFAN